jgi:hypothetical protein
MKKIVTLSAILLGLISAGAYAVQSLPQSPSDPHAADRKQEERRNRQVHRGTGGDSRKLTERAAGSEATVFVRKGVGMPVLSPHPVPSDFASYVGRMVEAADAIVVGTARGRKAQLTEDETFIFTKYELAVEEVLKGGSAAAAVRPNDTIVVARSGGKMKLNGKDVIAEDDSFKPLKVGERYLLFINHLPEKNLYTAFNSAGSFLLKGNKIFKLTEESLPAELKDGGDAAALLRVISEVRNRAAASAPGR